MQGRLRTSPLRREMRSQGRWRITPTVCGLSTSQLRATWTIASLPTCGASPQALPPSIFDRLCEFTPTRGLAFGDWAEMSADVHDLLRQSAVALASKHWRRNGSRSQGEALGYYTQEVYRRMGVAVSAAFDRHRISRIPLIGVPLATLRDRAGMRRVAVGGVHDGAVDPQDFYADQVRMRVALRDRH